MRKKGKLILQGKKTYQILMETVRERKHFQTKKLMQTETIAMFKSPLKTDYLHWPVSKAIDKDKQGQSAVSSDSVLVVWIRWTKRAGIIH